MTIGKGKVISTSTKQKRNTRSSTEVKLVGVNDMIRTIMWTKQFIESQVFRVNKNNFHQDNQSAIKLGNNGKDSNGN